jgi:hypothetical protein
VLFVYLPYVWGRWRERSARELDLCLDSCLVRGSLHYSVNRQSPTLKLSCLTFRNQRSLAESLNAPPFYRFKTLYHGCLFTRNSSFEMAIRVSVMAHFTFRRQDTAFWQWAVTRLCGRWLHSTASDVVLYVIPFQEELDVLSGTFLDFRMSKQQLKEFKFNTELSIPRV